jgi:molybdopterin/thiamine biosynthesis adenylyltransferase
MAHVVVIGAGAIGSQVLPHVARMPGVYAVTVIDRDRYESSNVAAQNIAMLDVGKSKAQTQAARLKQINRSLNTTPIHMPVEDLPLGWLRADVMLACLDSRRARMVVNQAAWRLGVPWIDAGVDASGLARVQVFLPEDDAPCLECGWNTDDYRLVEQHYACHQPSAPPATRATSELGGLAAALQASECRKLLSGDRDNLLAGRDLMIDSRHHKHYVTRFHRNTDCRMPDHGRWTIAASDADPASTTPGQLASMANGVPESGCVRVRVAGQQFAVALTCGVCGTRSQAMRLNRGEFRRDPPACPDCGGSCTAAGFDLQDDMLLAELPEPLRNRPLAELGLISGDVVTLTTKSDEVRLELRGAGWPIEF